MGAPLGKRSSAAYAGLWKWDSHVKARLASASLDDFWQVTSMNSCNGFISDH